MRVNVFEIESGDISDGVRDLGTIKSAVVPAVMDRWLDSIYGQNVLIRTVHDFKQQT
jgi:hypothetical protein